MTRYLDPIIKKYADLITSKNGSIKTFFQGEPVRIATSLLPCLVISKSETEVRPLTNTEDDQAIGLTITLITDVRSDLSTTENDSKITEGISTLYDMIEGRNADYTLKDTAILNILRENEHVDTTTNLRTDLGTITRVSYGETLRDRNKEEWTVEARIQLVARFSQIR